MKYILSALFTLFFLIGYSQCPNDNTQIGSAITPTCPGSTPVTGIQGGRFILLNVISGNVYTFSTCGETWDTEITLYSTTGTFLAYNDDACGLQSVVTWTATFTGQIRILVDRFPCSSTSLTSTVTIDCYLPIPPGPSPPEDCIGSITICNDQSFNNNTNNTGNAVDLSIFTSGCLSALERQGTWYNFTIANGGHLAFDINPSDPNDDYDFAIWGPFSPGSSLGNICPPISEPIRCSFSATSGQTGLNYTSTDISEGVSGDKWVKFIPVSVGQIYLMYISNFSQSGLSFGLDWNLGNGASLNCLILDIDLASFSGNCDGSNIDLQWSTFSERNVDRFIIEHSNDGFLFEERGSVTATGWSNEIQWYRFIDTYSEPGINYYRLKTIDVDGTVSKTNIIPIECEITPQVMIVNLSPQPGRATLTMNSTEKMNAYLQIHDLLGKLIFSERIEIIPGKNEIQFDISNHSNGYYHILLREENILIGQAKYVKNG